jgi:hypothetical protein
MVRNIINVVEDRCEEGQFPEEFRNRVRQNIGFSESRKIVQDEWNNPERVQVNSIDLWGNLVKSKISKFGGQTLGQTYNTYGSTIPIRPTVSVLHTNQNEAYRSQYQTPFVPTTQA